MTAYVNDGGVAFLIFSSFVFSSFRAFVILLREVG